MTSSRASEQQSTSAQADSVAIVNARTRYEWIDVAKGLAIILVVYGHVYRGLVGAGIIADGGTLARLDTLIYAFHIPLFFFMSGLLLTASLERRPLYRFLLSKVDSIAVPFIVWSCVQGGIEIVLSSYTNGRFGTDIGALLWPPRGQFWFLFALLLSICAAALQKVLVRDDRAILLMNTILLMVSGGLPAPFSYSAEGLFYVTVGLVLSRSFDILRAIQLLFAMCIGVLLVAGFSPVSSVATYIDHGVAAWWAGVGILLTASIAKAMPTHQKLAALGRFTMPILVLHIICASGVRVVLDKFLNIENPILHLVGGMAAGLILPLIAITVAERVHLRWLFGLRPPYAFEYWLPRASSRTSRNHENLH